jgi:hypothetical protein
MTTADALYVYGVVRSGTSAEVFAGVRGMDAAPVQLVEADGVAAIASPVRLAEFGEEALERNLKDGAWLEQQVQAHNRVLEAAVGRTTVLPLRFGAIYHSAEHVRAMLAERPQLASQLARLDGLLEFGVKAVVDPEALRDRLAQARGTDPAEGGGRAYMQRKLQAREVEEEVRAFAAECGNASHAQLAAVAVDARANPAQAQQATGGEMLLNGAYLLAAEREDELRSTLEDLQSRFGPDGVTYELTGPWPPYNFAAEEPA